MRWKENEKHDGSTSIVRQSQDQLGGTKQRHKNLQMDYTDDCDVQINT